jgi:hypothetical protein
MGQRAPKVMKNGSCSLEPQSLPLVIPERTRIPSFVAIARTTGAVSLKGNRMKLINATILDRKSGGAQWRDLRFNGPFLEMVFRQSAFFAKSSRTLPSCVLAWHIEPPRIGFQ